jgi:hypothetical protein
MNPDLELFTTLTSELSKLENEILNTSICSYEIELDDMSTEQFLEAGQELVWIATDLAAQDTFEQSILEEAELVLEQIQELL